MNDTQAGVQLCELQDGTFVPLPEEEKKAASGPFPVQAARMMGLYICQLCPRCNLYCPDPELYGDFSCDDPDLGACPVYDPTRVVQEFKRAVRDDAGSTPTP